MLYPMLIAFILVFISELGDKTQLLVLSFSSKLKTRTILIGIAIGSFLSHGIAILFGSSLGLLNNSNFHEILKLFTYLSFILFGFITLFSMEREDNQSKSSFVQKLSYLKIHYILIIAFSIAVGELGDKTFLASIGLGIQYPTAKVYLILGAILGMVVSDCIAILFGKFLSKKISEKSLQRLSGFIFLLFGILGLAKFISTLL